MRVTKWGECGVLCALFLTHRYGQGAVGAPEIAESQGLDLQYTQQVLHRLRKGEIVESVRGPKGGFRLTREPSAITLKEILYAAEGDTFEIICDYAPIRPSEMEPNQCSTKETCGLHTVWVDLRDAINKLLAERTLEALAATMPPPKALVSISHR
jgi:Rrf2 family iron-sulfur cluster assembly transcriptional regulator